MRGAIMDGVSAVVNKILKASQLFCQVRTQGEAAKDEAGSGLSSDTEYAGVLILDFLLPSRTVGNECPLFVSHSIHGVLLQQPEIPRIDSCASEDLSQCHSWDTFSSPKAQQNLPFMVL